MTTPVGSNSNSPKFQQIPYPYNLQSLQIDPEFITSNNFIDENTPCDLSSAFSTLDTPLLEPALLESVAWNIDRFVAPTPATSNPQILLEESMAHLNPQWSNESENYQPQSRHHLSASSVAPQGTGKGSRATRKTARNNRSKSRESVDESVASDNASSQDSEGERLTEKRRRNKLAARRLRQKKMDQFSELEEQLQEAKRERDELRIQAAKWEGEAQALRQMLDQSMNK